MINYSTYLCSKNRSIHGIDETQYTVVISWERQIGNAGYIYSLKKKQIKKSSKIWWSWVVGT